MESKYEEKKELDLDQMEKVSGGAGKGYPGINRKIIHVCQHCGETFTDDRKWVDHCRECDPNFRF